MQRQKHAATLPNTYVTFTVRTHTQTHRWKNEIKGKEKTRNTWHASQGQLLWFHLQMVGKRSTLAPPRNTTRMCAPEFQSAWTENSAWNDKSGVCVPCLDKQVLCWGAPMPKKQKTKKQKTGNVTTPQAILWLVSHTLRNQWSRASITGFLD